MLNINSITTYYNTIQKANQIFLKYPNILIIIRKKTLKIEPYNTKLKPNNDIPHMLK